MAPGGPIDRAQTPPSGLVDRLITHHDHLPSKDA